MLRNAGNHFMFSKEGLFAFIFVLFAIGANFLEKKLRNAFLLNPIVILKTNCTAVVNRFQTAIPVFTPPSVLHSSPLGKNCLDSLKGDRRECIFFPLFMQPILFLFPPSFSPTIKAGLFRAGVQREGSLHVSASNSPELSG